MNLQKYCEKRAMSGYGSALLYKEANENLYHLVLPLETIPTVSGSTDTFDFDILTCPSKGQVEGKESLEQVDIDFLWHRDNVARLQELQGRVLDFMVVYQDFTARTFTGTIKVRPQDAGADIMRGTFTVTPMSASTVTLLDARDMIQDTIWFTNQIPSSITLKSDDTKGTDIILSTNPSAYIEGDSGYIANVNFVINTDETDKEGQHTLLTISEPSQDNDTSNAKITIGVKSGVTSGYALVFITATKKGEDGKDILASWTTSIAVEIV